MGWSGMSLRGRLLSSMNVLVLAVVLVVTALLLVNAGNAFDKMRRKNAEVAGQIQERQKAEIARIQKDQVEAAARAFRARIEGQATLVANLAPTPLLTFDTSALDLLVSQTLADPDVQLCYIVDRKKKIQTTVLDTKKRVVQSAASGKMGIAEVAQALRGVPNVLETTRAISQDGAVIGEVVVLAQDNAAQQQSRYDAFLKESERMFAEQDESGRRLADEQVRNGLWFGVVNVVVALLLTVFVVFLVARSIAGQMNAVVGRLTQSSHDVSQAASQVLHASQSMAEGSSTQASSLEETSASLEQMSSMTQHNADNARQASQMVGQAQAAVESGSQTMSRMESAIGEIKKSSDETARILKTIDEIAFQTNLLALNAAVEAARAGEAGKGFAVVAEEVRNLAMRSSEAARSTSALIEASQKNAENGVAVSRQVAASLADVQVHIRKVTQLVGEVSTASGEQAKGIEQVNRAVSDMDKVTQANAANAEESASASEQLSSQSRGMEDMIARLVQLVHGAGSEDRRAGGAVDSAAQVVETSMTGAAPRRLPEARGQRRLGPPRAS